MPPPSLLLLPCNGFKSPGVGRIDLTLLAPGARVCCHNELQALLTQGAVLPCVASGDYVFHLVQVSLGLDSQSHGEGKPPCV